MNRILIMEDDTVIKEELSILLATNGYLPVDKPPCDLALLDINMPGENGYEVCRKLRKTSDIPVVFLTARGTPEDELLGFAVGADDFIRKPYNSAVLLARISRRLRQKSTTILQAKGLILDLSVLTVQYNQNSIELTKNEARILACLMKKELCTKDEIIEELWNNSMYIDENTLYVNINRLREKLKSLGTSKMINNVRGVGYRL